jgi:hypothetical protein
VQPTDPTVWSVFVSLRHGGRKEDERVSGRWRQGLVGKQVLTVKAKILGILGTLGAVLAIAIAGGASLNGF